MSSGSSGGSASGGLGFVGALTITLIVLKLTHVIHLSWWWVWSPVWITFLAVVVVLAVSAFVFLAKELVKDAGRRKRARR